MEISIRPILSYIFILLCVSATISMLVYWSYKFKLDEDSSVITYRKFYERESDVYPTISICLESPFLNQRLAEYGVDQSLYLKFLRGDYFSEDMLKIDYSNVTFDISDHVKGYEMYFRNGSKKLDLKLSITEKRRLTHNSYNGFNNFGRRFLKCFALEIPKIYGLLIFRILLSNNIFQRTQCERPVYNGFKVVYHIPQQYMLSGENEKWVWPYRASNESYKTRFLIGDLTVMKKRNTKKYRCIESNGSYDNWFADLHRNVIKCNLPYLKFDKHLPMCNCKELMKRGLIQKSLAERQNLHTPCRTMENIDIQYLESTMTTNKSTIRDHVGNFWLSVTFKNPTFKEIEQKRYSARF